MTGALTAIAAVLALATAAAQPAHATFPGGNGRLVYEEVFDHDPPSDCYTVDDPSFCEPDREAVRLASVFPSGADARRLRTCRPVDCGPFRPAFSPDGRRLTYITAHPNRLLVSREDGSRARRVPLPADMGVQAAAWSPDGRRLAFSGIRPWTHPESGRRSIEARIYSVRPDGSRLRAMTSGPRDFSPDWSSRGEIAFLRNVTDDDDAATPWNARLFVLGTSGERRVTDVSTKSVSWSPDGRRLAFHGGPRPGGVWIVGVHGRKLRRVLDFGYEPTWSPDGRSIAVGVAAAGGGRNELRVYSLAARKGRLVRRWRVTYSQAIAWQPLPELLSPAAARRREP
jgi:Tol biopolymer transport system component